MVISTTVRGVTYAMHDSGAVNTVAVHCGCLFAGLASALGAGTFRNRLPLRVPTPLLRRTCAYKRENCK
eukprot:3103411-Amphidinium_carterae.1